MTERCFGLRSAMHSAPALQLVHRTARHAACRVAECDADRAANGTTAGRLQGKLGSSNSAPLSLASRQALLQAVQPQLHRVK